jgi:hypothetical protein
MSISPSNQYKINNMLQKYKDDVTLDQIIESLKSITSSNRKKCIQECKEMIQTIQDKNSKKYIRTIQLLQDIEFDYVEKNIEKKITPALKLPIKIVNTFENWIIDMSNTELRLFMNTSDTYSQGEQVYYCRKLIEEYTKYVSECSRQFTIPSPFPNIDIFNRTCESITLENGRIIKNPNYIPDYKAPIWFCCFQ